MNLQNCGKKYIQLFQVFLVKNNEKALGNPINFFSRLILKCLCEGTEQQMIVKDNLYCSVLHEL